MRKTRKLQVLGAIFGISMLAVTACGGDDDDSAGSACEVGQIDGDLALRKLNISIQSLRLGNFVHVVGKRSLVLAWLVGVGRLISKKGRLHDVRHLFNLMHI